MSSASFSTVDLNIIRALLNECPSNRGWGVVEEANAARYLMSWAKAGIHGEEELRTLLHDYSQRRREEAADLARWDAEGGAQSASPVHGQYGRRIEADGTWTIYEVFTGREARQRGLMPSGLTKEEALDRLVRFSAGGIGASGDELRADGRSSYSFWRRDL